MKLASKKQDQFRLKSDSFEVLVIKGGQKSGWIEEDRERGESRKKEEEE